MRSRGFSTSHALGGLCLTLLVFAGPKLSAQTDPAGPSWWYNPALTTTGTAPAFSGNPADFAVANQGQVKNLAVTSINGLYVEIPQFIGTNETLSALEASLCSIGSNTEDYAAVNIGQMKNLVQPIYDFLLQTGYTQGPLISGTYPWIGSLTHADYALANIGQIKNLFDFDVTYRTDSTNPLPDWWQMHYFGSLGVSAYGASPSGDGYTNWDEYENGWNPLQSTHTGQTPGAPVGVQTFEYDAAGRLHQDAVSNGVNYTYSYDQEGNIQSASH
jgi:YD repeat-containing protein